MHRFDSMSSAPSNPDLPAVLSNVYVRGTGVRAVERARLSGKAHFEIGKQLYSELKDISRQLEDVIDHIMQRGVPDLTAGRIVPMLHNLQRGTPGMVAVAERQLKRGNILMEGMPESIKVLDRKVSRAIAKLETQLRDSMESDLARMGDFARQPSPAALKAAEDAMARMSAPSLELADAWAERLASQVAPLTD